MNFCSAFAAATIAVSLAASPASAAQKLFRLFGDADASFVLPGSPTPSSAGENEFVLYNVSGSFNGVSGIFDLYFYTTVFLGGFDIEGSGDLDVVLQATGPQLFSGSSSAPTLTTGTFRLVEALSGSGDYTLVISEVPEPASWALLIAGFGLTGAAMRRRRRVVA